MRALLDLPTVRQRVHLMSVDEYHLAGQTGVLTDDVELLRGIVVTKMPKSPQHELVAEKAMDLLLALLPKEFKTRREGPLTLRDSEPEPDISVVKGKREDWAKAHPSSASLVVEVAVTSEEMDENKAGIYAEAGIPEYWLVRVQQRSIQVFTEPTRDGYLSQRTYGEQERLRCTSIPNLEFTIRDILPEQHS